MKRKLIVALLALPLLCGALSGCVVYGGGGGYYHHPYWR
jgi:hypothetical protein